MSGQLAKARLVALDEIKGTGKDPTPSYREQDKSALYVQFNPTSLKISRTNNQDRGASTTKSQARTNPSAQSATLTFDLEFDTAELSDAQGVPVDVRSLTKIVRRFAEPTKEKPTSPPPPVRFVWGTFIFQGLVTQLTEDLDYFSNDGYPLRAKVSVTITEKNPDWEAKKIGEAARSLPSATPTGSGQGSGPGSKPASNPDTTTKAQDGESVQQLLTRLNADPAAWRSAMAGLDSPLGLVAGAQVQIAAGASAAVGIGAAAGFSLGAGASASATLGLRSASRPALRRRRTCRRPRASPPRAASLSTVRPPRGSPSPRAAGWLLRTLSSRPPARRRRRRPHERRSRCRQVPSHRLAPQLLSARSRWVASRRVRAPRWILARRGTGPGSRCGPVHRRPPSCPRRSAGRGRCPPGPAATSWSCPPARRCRPGSSSPPVQPVGPRRTPSNAVVTAVTALFGGPLEGDA